MKRITVAIAVAALVFALAPIVQAGTSQATDDKANMKLVGEVVRVDSAGMTFAVKESVKSGTAKEISFQLAKDGKVMLNTKTAALKDVKVGDSITVQYQEISGKKIANECTIARKA